MKISKKTKGWIIGTLAFIILFHISVPFILIHYVNKSLDEIPGYTGSIDWIHVNLFRGAYQIHDLQILKVDENFTEPFFSTKTLDLSISWGALIKGRITGDIHFSQPELVFMVVGDSTVESQTGENVDWTKPIKDLMPLEINFFETSKGVIHYKDIGSDPKVDIYVSDLDLVATNLSNADSKPLELPSTLKVSATSIGGGKLNVDGKLNILQSTPSFDINLKFENIDVPALNNFFLAYLNVDMEEGTLNFYSEVSGAEGDFDGYIKPLMTNLKVVDWEKDKKKPLNLIWQSIVGAITEVFENQKEDQFATKVPIQGTYSDMNPKVLSAIGNVLKNAFIEAFKAQTDNTIELEDFEDE